MRGNPHCLADLSDILKRRTARDGDCLIWTGRKLRSGYGIVEIAGRRLYAHRAVYELTNGPIPTGVVIRHRCDTPSCVELAHLEAGTPRDNSADMVARGRSTKGRQYTGPSARFEKRSVALALDMWPALEAEAKRMDASVSTIVRQAIRVYLANVRQATERRAS